MLSLRGSEKLWLQRRFCCAVDRQQTYGIWWISRLNAEVGRGTGISGSASCSLRAPSRTPLLPSLNWLETDMKDIPPRTAAPIMIRGDTGEALVPMDAMTALTTPEALEAQTALIVARDRAIRALVTPNDSRNGYWIRSAYRKLGRAFQLSQETVNCETHFLDPTAEELEVGIPFHVVAQVRVRTWAPWGQYVESTGTATTREPSYYYAQKDGGGPRMTAFGRAEHDCTSKAETRAKNKGIDDMLALGRADDVTEFDEDRLTKLAGKTAKRQEEWTGVLSKAGIEPEAEQAYYDLNPHMPANESLFELADYEQCLRHWEKHGSAMFDRALERQRELEGVAFDDIIGTKFEPASEEKERIPEEPTLARVDKEVAEERKGAEAEAQAAAGQVSIRAEAEARKAAGVSLPQAEAETGKEDSGTRDPAKRFFTPEELEAGKEAKPAPAPGPAPAEPDAKETSAPPVRDQPGTKEKILALAEIEDYTKKLGEAETYPLTYASIKTGRDLVGMADLTPQEAIDVAAKLKADLASQGAGS